MSRFRKWLKRQLYIPKHAKIHDKSFSRIMISAALGIILCTICLTGMTLAWFSVSVGTVGNTIQAAEFSVRVSVDGVEYSAEADGIFSFSLSGGAVYEITLTASGDASTGYCKVVAGESQYYTKQIPQDGSLSFYIDCLSASETFSVSVEPQWGTYIGASDESVQLIGRDLETVTVVTSTGNGILNNAVNGALNVSQSEPVQTNRESYTPSGNAQTGGVMPADTTAVAVGEETTAASDVDSGGEKDSSEETTAAVESNEADTAA